MPAPPVLPQVEAAVWPLVTARGLPVTVSWSTTGADHVRVVGRDGELTPQGRSEVELSAGNRAVVEAVNGAGRVHAQTAPVVVVDPPAFEPVLPEAPPARLSAHVPLHPAGPGGRALDWLSATLPAARSSQAETWAGASATHAGTPGTAPPAPTVAPLPAPPVAAPRPARGPRPEPFPRPVPAPLPAVSGPVQTRLAAARTAPLPVPPPLVHAPQEDAP